MSIIYDALKKIEASIGSGSPFKINKRERKAPKLKSYLIYGLVACLGFFIAKIAFGLFTKYFISAREQPTIAQKAQMPVPPATEISKPRIPEEEPQVVPEPSLSESSEAGKSTPPLLVLNGVFFSEEQGYALINNRIVKVGDEIAGVKVVRITLDEVECSYQGSAIKLFSTQK